VPVPDLLDQLARAGPRGIEESPGSRAQVEVCRQWGFQIQEKDNRFFLPFDSDSLVPVWIEQETPGIVWDRLRVEGFLAIGSTNEEGLARARGGDPGALLIYAETQTAGRGRKGRRWESPPGGGLYFTLVLKPAPDLNRWPLLTFVAGAALAQALIELGESEGFPARFAVDLKWPNDVLLGGKKAAGVLLETACSARGPAVVLGVGINVRPGCVPEELRLRASSVSDEAGALVARRKLLVRFLYFFQMGYNLFENGRHADILENWKRHSSMWDGVPVWIVEAEKSIPAVTCGLSDAGALRVRTVEGIVETILAGDVRLRRSR